MGTARCTRLQQRTRKLLHIRFIELFQEWNLAPPWKSALVTPSFHASILPVIHRCNRAFEKRNITRHTSSNLGSIDASRWLPTARPTFLIYPKQRAIAAAQKIGSNHGFHRPPCIYPGIRFLTLLWLPAYVIDRGAAGVFPQHIGSGLVFKDLHQIVHQHTKKDCKQIR